MAFGIMAMILVGCCWTVMGIVLANAPRRGVDVALLLLAVSALTLLIGLAAGLAEGVPAADARLLALGLGAAGLGGIFNFYQQELAARAMQTGPTGIIWSIAQSGLIFPFCMGVFFFGSPLTWTRGLGFLLVIVAMPLLGLSRKNTVCGRWRLLTFGAFLMTGLCQCAYSLPSYSSAAEAVSGRWRTAAMMAGFIVGALTSRASMWNRLPRLFLEQFRRREMWISCGTLLALYVVSTFFLLYAGTDALANAGIGAIAFPLAVCSTLLSFELYAIFVRHEKRSALQLLAMGLCVVGMTGLCL